MRGVHGAQGLGGRPDVAAGGALAVPRYRCGSLLGHYTATIAKVDGRGRSPVSLKLQEFQPVECEQRPLDFVRPRLILKAGEGSWKVLPGKSAPKCLRVIPEPHLR